MSLYIDPILVSIEPTDVNLTLMVMDSDWLLPGCEIHGDCPAQRPPEHHDLICGDVLPGEKLMI